MSLKVIDYIRRIATSKRLSDVINYKLEFLWWFLWGDYWLCLWKPKYCVFALKKEFVLFKKKNKKSQNSTEISRKPNWLRKPAKHRSFLEEKIAAMSSLQKIERQRSFSKGKNKKQRILCVSTGKHQKRVF